MTGRRILKSLLAAGAAAGALAIASACAAQGLPTGGVVVASTPGGGASINTVGQTMTISQASDRVVIDWTTFNIGAPNTVNFVQPSNSSIAFNRVPGAVLSSINGQLSGNGGVFIFSNGGITVGSTGRIDTGSLVLATGLPDPSDYTTMLSTNTVMMRAPATLNPLDPFPAVTIQAGAEIETGQRRGTAALLVAPGDLGIRHPDRQLLRRNCG